MSYYGNASNSIPFLSQNLPDAQAVTDPVNPFTFYLSLGSCVFDEYNSAFAWHTPSSGNLVLPLLCLILVLYSKIILLDAKVTEKLFQASQASTRVYACRRTFCTLWNPAIPIEQQVANVGRHSSSLSSPLLAVLCQSLFEGSLANGWHTFLSDYLTTRVAVGCMLRVLLPP
ncbi:hypothetical protein F4679DRAFT_164887 [Xylaria curta]|nr:hypothetical protein F4679DRAFT_164887 [Xylaria curta]